MVEERRFTVVVNDEEQYSIWPEAKKVPDGWSEVGFRGPKAHCLAYIDRTWLDMRPRSARTGAGDMV